MRYLISARLFCAILTIPRIVTAHGFVGDRFFPPTVTTDDPFATDELSLPTISVFTAPAGDGSPETRVLDAGFEFDKEIFPKFAVGVSDDYLWQKPRGEKSTSGWDDIGLSAKLQLWQNDLHEAIISIGLEANIPYTGRNEIVGDDDFATLTPTFYFGKGFGDLPDNFGAWKPFAITGTLGEDIPMRTSASNALEWGFAIEYSLPYLQQNVKDIGLPEPLKNMIPLVEFSFSTTENRDGHGLTTGTINPGVLYESRYFQFGVEALIPPNGSCGPHVGAVMNVQIFIDDIFPKAFGFPLFGGSHDESTTLP